MDIKTGLRMIVGTYTDIDGEKNIIGKVKKVGFKTKDEALCAAKSDDPFYKKWFGSGSPTHSAVYKCIDATYALLKIDKDYTKSIAYGENAHSPGVAKENVEFID